MLSFLNGLKKEGFKIVHIVPKVQITQAAPIAVTNSKKNERLKSTKSKTPTAKPKSKPNFGPRDVFDFATWAETVNVIYQTSFKYFHRTSWAFGISPFIATWSLIVSSRTIEGCTVSFRTQLQVLLRWTVINRVSCQYIQISRLNSFSPPHHPIPDTPVNILVDGGFSFHPI